MTFDCISFLSPKMCFDSIKSYVADNYLLLNKEKTEVNVCDPKWIMP